MILMCSCMKESNHHQLEKNQDRHHHFGQLPWSLKNPDGTHRALGRGWGWKRGTGEKTYKQEHIWGRARQAEWSPISLRTRVYAHAFLRWSHMASHQWSGAAGLVIQLHRDTLQHHTLFCSLIKTHILLLVTEKKITSKKSKPGGQVIWPIKLIPSMNFY